MTDEEFKSSATALRQAVVAVAGRIVGLGANAEDIAQETLARLWEMRQALRPPAEKLARVVARNIAIDALRRRRLSVSIEAAAEIADAPPDESHERYARIMGIIDTLPRASQTIIRLRLMEGMEYSEISKLTGMSQAAIRQSVSRARIEILKRYKRIERSER